jgi:hypothetical protein
MPNVKFPERIDLNNIKNGRFDANGHIVPDACFNFPACETIPAAKRGNPGAAPATQSPITTPAPTAGASGDPPNQPTQPSQSTQSTQPTLPPPPPK